MPSKRFYWKLRWLCVHCVLFGEWCLLIEHLRVLRLLMLLTGCAVQLTCLLATGKVIFIIIISLFAIDNILEGRRFALRILLLFITARSGTALFLLRNNGFHMAEFLFEGSEHLLRDLKLNCSWVMLYGQGVWAQVLYEGVILPIIVALAHLQHHILVTAQLLTIRHRCRHWAFGRSRQVAHLRRHTRRKKI